MAKTEQQRLDDTYSYIQQLLGKPAKDKIAGFLESSASNLLIKKQLELGGARIVKLAAETERRRAVRACILVNAVVRDSSVSQAAAEKIKILANAKAVLDKNIKDVYAKISYMSIPSGGAEDVVTFAVENLASMPTYDNSVNVDFIDWEKGVVSNKQTPFNCYTSLVYWAFHGGAISYKWLREYQVASRTQGDVSAGQSAMADMLRKKAIVRAPRDTTLIPAGSTVIYERHGNPLGHTVMSIGDGKCVSHNNVRGITTDLMKRLGDKLVMDMATGRPHVCSIDDYLQFYTTEQGYELMYGAPFWTLYSPSER